MILETSLGSNPISTILSTIKIWSPSSKLIVRTLHVVQSQCTSGVTISVEPPRLTLHRSKFLPVRGTLHLLVFEKAASSLLTQRKPQKSSSTPLGVSKWTFLPSSTKSSSFGRFSAVSSANHRKSKFGKRWYARLTRDVTVKISAFDASCSPKCCTFTATF